MLKKEFVELKTLYNDKNQVKQNQNVSNPINKKKIKPNNSFFNKVLNKLNTK